MSNMSQPSKFLFFDLLSSFDKYPNYNQIVYYYHQYYVIAYDVFCYTFEYCKQNNITDINSALYKALSNNAIIMFDNQNVCKLICLYL